MGNCPLIFSRGIFWVFSRDPTSFWVSSSILGIRIGALMTPLIPQQGSLSNISITIGGNIGVYKLYR
jgi:hypothetical protein